MHELGSLRLNGADQSWVAVADRANGDTGAEIEVFLALIIPEVGARSLFRHDREPAIGWQDVLSEFVVGRH